ncbi:MAG: PH domain-containing protein [Candidatus Micrarchaeota archaeon]|nr:PH domain-containing protein [Candidatus Micrarchaeota archaeon]
MQQVEEQSSNSRYIPLIKDLLQPDEEVELVITQTRYWPMVSANSIFKPKIIFATNRRVIIIARHQLGLVRSYSIFPYKIIIAVKPTRGIFLSSIAIGHQGSMPSDDIEKNEPKNVSGLRHEDAMRLEHFINAKIVSLPRNPLSAEEQAQSDMLKHSKGLKCLNCGTMNETASDYCSHCGTRL